MKKAKTKTSTTRHKIELQELLSETQTKSFERIRLTRVRYHGSEYNYVDIRVFRRGFDQQENEIYFPTTKGITLREEDLMEMTEKIRMDWLNRQIKLEGR